MINVDKKVLEERKVKLDACRLHLKHEFIGIDKVVDDLIDYCQVWYLMPEILSRPVIVNLWGMTGVGKTDLVRKMIKFLDYQDRFAEIELSNVDETSWDRSVSGILDSHSLNDEKPCVVLFDEIQRFNTLDVDGKPMPQTKFTDFWELLSDGRLSKKTKADLDSYLYSYMFRQKENKRKKEKGEELGETNPFVSQWEAQHLNNSLGFNMDMDQLSELREEDLLEMIKGAKKKKKIYEPINHSQTLIIISGNLDEAFQMAGQTSEADVDADIFHAFTKKITVVDVKNALSRKFRPEQVARFGNIHMIYPSLQKKHFEKLIEREVTRVQTQTEAKTGVSIDVDVSVNDLIYRNGVFPVQGVRPVFSSVTDILDTNLNKFLFDAIMANEPKLSIEYDVKKQLLRSIYGKTKTELHYVGRIDKIREGNEEDAVANISVHECGHAVAYMSLFEMAPLQLKSKVASSYAGGFTFPHSIHENKENLIKKIKIYLAGGIAEEIIFGKEFASIGRSHDREQATGLLLDYVRRYGFDDEFQATYTLDFYPHAMDKTITDLDVEKMMARLVSDTKELLSNNLPLLKDLSNELSKKGSMEALEVAEIGKKHKLEVSVKPEGFFAIHNYAKNIN